MRIWSWVKPFKPRRVAIVGGGPTRKDAPYDDMSWEIWGFSSKDDHYPRLNRWFEIHAMEDLKQQLAAPKKGRRRFDDYMEFLRNLRCPVYMMHVHPDVPTSVAFPGPQLVGEFGRCFTSTAAFLIGLAIYEKCDEIGIWGVSGMLANDLSSGIYLAWPRRKGSASMFQTIFRFQFPTIRCLLQPRFSMPTIGNHRKRGGETV